MARKPKKTQAEKGPYPWRELGIEVTAASSAPGVYRFGIDDADEDRGVLVLCGEGTEITAGKIKIEIDQIIGANVWVRVIRD